MNRGKLSLEQVNRRNMAAPYARDKALVQRLAAEQEAPVPPFAPERGPIEVLEGAGPGLRPATLAPAGGDEKFRKESVVLRRGRPVLAIREGQTVLEFRESESAVWKEKLSGAGPALKGVIPSVGRIELTNLIAYPSVGTGWMVDRDIIATNRHVAEYFVERGTTGFKFRLGDDRRKVIGAKIDFLEEIGSTLQSEFDLTEIVFVAPSTLPDIALFRVRASAGSVVPPSLQLSKASSSMGKTVAVVGYPHRDPDLPDQKLADEIFGNIYERKRIAPGFVMDDLFVDITHDCTTLPGNSGSPVIDLETGEIVGLHRAGIFLTRNLAVTATRVRETLDLARRPPVIGIGTSGQKSEAKPVVGLKNGDAPMGEVKITVPLTITISLGSPQLGGTPTVVVDPVVVAKPAPQVRTGLTWEEIERAIPPIRLALGNRADVVAVKPGYRVTEGVMSREPVVVVAVRQRHTPEELQSMGITPIPTTIDGYPIDVTIASMAEVLGMDPDLDVEAPWTSEYQERPDIPLDAVKANMTITLSPSPDAGWPTLREFLSGVKTTLTVAMYDFGAPHVLKAVREAVRPAGRNMTLVIQEGESLDNGTKKDDVEDKKAIEAIFEDIGARLDFSYASVAKVFGMSFNPKGLFEYSYHIKVAVRDNDAFWLSSGNWQSSNQPPTDDPAIDLGTPTNLWNKYNREWHVVVEHKGLAKTFRKHIERDLVEAKATARDEAVPGVEQYVWVPIEYFEPSAIPEAPYVLRQPLRIEGRIEIHPLLTPDNFAKTVLALLKRAEKRILFQNQTFKPKAEGAREKEEFRDLVDIMLQKQHEIPDVRILIRQIGDDYRQVVTNIHRRGFDPERLKDNAKCHTKGIVVDDKAVVIGSHNWSPSGVITNRDASLIIYDKRAVEYFADLFEADWRRSAAPHFNENAPPVRLADPADPIAPARMVRVPLRDWLNN